MSPLVGPEEAVVALRRTLTRRWAEAVCAEFGVGEHVTFSVPLRPGVATGKAVERLGTATWHAWSMRWRAVAGQLPAGVALVRKTVSLRGVSGDFPATLTANLDGALALANSDRPNRNNPGRDRPGGDSPGGDGPIVDVDRARALASALRSAGAILTAATLRATYRLREADAQVLMDAVSWLHRTPDASGWTLRQLPVPGMHTKWLDTHGALLRDVAGRDVREEVRPRLAVVHLTYVDPEHAASGRRRHDAWTTGDVHEIAYRPRLVLVVENRDCRLWFPPVEEVIVVEGGGKAAPALLATVPWLRAADHLLYWGDMDADGYAILDHFRATLAEPTPDGAPAKPVASILMDGADLHRYSEHGVDHDKAGRPIAPSSARLPRLTQAEATAYHTIATAGPTPFRRIEQEAIPLADAAARLRRILNG